MLDALVAQGGDPQAIVEAEGLGAIGGGDELAEVVQRALASDPDAVAKLKGGNMKAIGPIVGFVMRETKGRADGGEVTRLVREQLGSDVAGRRSPEGDGRRVRRLQVARDRRSV